MCVCFLLRDPLLSLSLLCKCAILILFKDGGRKTSTHSVLKKGHLTQITEEKRYTHKQNLTKKINAHIIISPQEASVTFLDFFKFTQLIKNPLTTERERERVEISREFESGD